MYQECTRNVPGFLVWNQDYQESYRNMWGSGKFCEMVINMAGRCGHLLVMPKLVIKLTTIENEHICSFSRVVEWW